MWLFPLEFFDHGYGGIVQLSHGEQDLERRILLFEKSSEIRFQANIQTGERFEDTDRFGRSQRGRATGQILKRRDDREQRVQEATSEKEQESGRYDGHVASGN